MKQNDNDMVVKNQSPNKLNPSWLVFLIGILVFGDFYYEVKEYLGGRWLFLFVAVAYIAGLRFFADVIAGKYKNNKKT